MTERIQKVLARAGVASRRQVEQWLREGRLTVNGDHPTLGTKIGPRDKIALDGRPIRLHEAKANEASTVVYHRASGISLKRSDDASSSELLSQLPGHASRRWIPMSPLPINDSGLELLTTDGNLAHAFLRHFSQVRSEFALRVFGDPRLEQLEQLKAGLLEDGETLKVDSVEMEGGEGINRWFKLSAQGAGARDIHRLCLAAGLQVNRLIRVTLGPIVMDRGLSRGRVRALELEEIKQLYELAGLQAPLEAPAATRRLRKAGPKTPKHSHKPDNSKSRQNPKGPSRSKSRASPKRSTRAQQR